jgi:2-polyprenyl-3-methyl-5-hydroxy-6-metoxy-1,4-benzoquinol methylase
MNLPTEVSLQLCHSDNFLFIPDIIQWNYDEYYNSLANDSYHSEVSGGNLRSPIAMIQSNHLSKALSKFFEEKRKVMDFGCGEASLLTELAIAHPGSSFYGFDPSPASQTGSEKAMALGLNNISIFDFETLQSQAP